MNRTDLKIASRNIRKNKIESLISVLGLGIGLGCIMILMVLVVHENSFDHFIPENQTAYRLIQDKNAQTAYPFAPYLKSTIPEIKDFFRFYQIGQIQIKSDNNIITEENLFGFADENIFRLLGLKFKYGVPAVSNSEIAISEKMAEKYFNAENIVGAPLQVKLKDKFQILTICGVYNNFPSNSTLHPEFIANIDLTDEVLGITQRMFGEFGSKQSDYRTWDINSFYTYLFLNPNANPDNVTGKIKSNMVSMNPEKFNKTEFFLQPVTDIYLNSNELSGNIYNRVGNADELKYYLAIALVILIIAIVNYIFLTKAKILNRLTEMGAKKALGATNSAIRKQVILESNLISALSIVPAILIVIAGIPFVNSTLGKTIGADVLRMWQTWGLFFAIVIITGSVSGLFIGSSISRTSVVVLLTGQLNKKRKKYSLNHSFLSFHFAVFILLIVSVFTFKKQINYGLTNFKAIDPKNILICEMNSPELQQQFQVISSEIAKNPNVLQTAGSSFIPPFGNFLPVQLQAGGEKVRFDGLIMGEGMIELLGMELIDGESFGEFVPGQTNIIFNESSALQYGFKAGELFNGFRVKGIVKDFTAHSIHSLIQPMAILQQNPEKMRLLAIKTNGLNDAAVIKDLEKIIKQISPETLAKINHLTDDINQFYRREQNQAKLITAFTLLAISLAIMGLFGIVLITISKRTKEIGIRKVNGARVTEVIEMLNKDFLKWVALAFTFATPASWYAMNKWLENFAYKTELSWWIFALAGILAFIIALLTVSLQSWKAASKNPVEALRYE